MRFKKLSLILIFTIIASLLQVNSFALYQPPTAYSAPTNVGVVFNGDDLDEDESGRWSFDIGLSASSEIRGIIKAFDEGLMDEAGYDSFNVGVQGDYKLDNGKWRSEIPGYDDWVFTQDTGFSHDTGTWVSNCHIYDGYFDEAIPDGILPGGKAFFDTHTMNFRVRFYISFYHSENDKSYEYYSPWSAAVSFSNNQKAEDPTKLINHAPQLISAELKKHDDGKPYLDLRATVAHNDLILLNNISNQRVYTNVWVKVNNGNWSDAGSYLFMKEQFTVEAQDYFTGLDNFDAAVYEVKFRYEFDNSYYPASGLTGYIYSPFSNTINHGMPAYVSASSWHIAELDQADELGFIIDSMRTKKMNEPITREEFAEVAVNFYEIVTGNQAVPKEPNPFTDCSNPEVLKAVALNITKGVNTAGTQFAPKNLLPREQMATMITRALTACFEEVTPTYIANQVKSVADFKDQKDVSTWAANSVKFMAKYNITLGDGKGSFLPKTNCTREQAIAFLLRSYNNRAQYIP